MRNIRRISNLLTTALLQETVPAKLCNIPHIASESHCSTLDTRIIVVSKGNTGVNTHVKTVSPDRGDVVRATVLSAGNLIGKGCACWDVIGFHNLSIYGRTVERDCYTCGRYERARCGRGRVAAGVAA